MEAVLVFGGFGQLGLCIAQEINFHPLNDFKFYFFESSTANITHKKSIASLFETHNPKYVINCAAYTAVDTAEDEKEMADAINNIGAKNVGELCNDFNSILIHVSTDFVFEGTKSSPLNENDTTKPIGVYGSSKLKGEIAISQSGCNYFIIRTSWLYSEFKANFLRTMLHLASTRDQLNVVADQVGTPTYAGDLAIVIIGIVKDKKSGQEIYHYSNEGLASWYDFAFEIFKMANKDISLSPIKTSEYPTKAVRPLYSVLDKSKIKKELGITIPHWKDSLQLCLNRMKK